MCLPCIDVYMSVRQACARGLPGFGQFMLKMAYLQFTSNPEPISTTTGDHYQGPNQACVQSPKDPSCCKWRGKDQEGRQVVGNDQG